MMPDPRILILNPNSNAEVTQAIASAVAPMAGRGVELVCETLEDGPAGIETQAHADSVPMPLLARLAERPGFQAYVIACYSDPGLHAAREAVAAPVFGIAECGVLTALTRGERFGVIAIRNRAIPRHIRYLRQMVLTDRFAGERAIEMSVADSVSGARTFERMREVGRALRDEDGANVIVMGCAGMSSYRARLEEALCLPVIDPTQAATAMAIGAVLVAAAHG